MPDNFPLDVAQTPDGYLWLVTRAGLVRFDGARFTEVPEASPEAKPGELRSLFVARDGTLWLGYSNGAVRRRRGLGWESVVPPPDHGDAVFSFAQDADGNLWFTAGYNTLRCLRDQRLSDFSIPPAKPSSEGSWNFPPLLQFTSSGKLWVAGTGVSIFDGEHFRSIIPPNSEIQLAATSRAGGVWVISGQTLFHYQDDGSGKREAADLAWLGSAGQTTHLFEDRAGNLWLSTRSRGLYRFRDGKFLQAPTSHHCISVLFQDRNEDLWVGTLGGGLNCLRPRAFSLRQATDGLPSDFVASLCVDSEDRLWLASDTHQPPVRALDAANRRFAAVPGCDFWGVQTMCADASGGVWCGTLSDLIYWRDGRSSNVSWHYPLASLLLDRAQNLWAGIIDWNIKCRRPDGSWKSLPDVPGLVHPRALAQGASGQIWVGTESGLVFRSQDDAFVPVPLPGEGSAQPVRFIVPDVNDTVWIGTLGGGLYRCRAGKAVRLPGDAGLPVDDLRCLAIMPTGDLWIGAGQGLYRVPRREVEACLDQRQSEVHAVTYGRNDGLPELDFAFGFKGATARTRDGRLWFATFQGALEITPEVLASPRPNVQVLIEEVRIGERVVSVGDRARFVVSERAEPVRISYTLPELREPEQVHFRYRLIGFGAEDWIDAGTQRSATFAHLRAGTYRFEVSGRSATGGWLSAASRQFVVSAVWWETIPFQIGVGLFFALGLAGLFRFLETRRLQRRLRVLEQKHALERERMRLARDLHDQVGANLTHIMLLAELAPSPENVAQLADSAREAVNSLDGVVWAANPRNDTLASLIQYLVRFAEDFLKAAGIRCRIDIPADIPEISLPPEFRHHVLLVVKETLNNVVKHSGAREVRLGAGFNTASLTLTVADNGRGFEAARALIDGCGQINMQERARAVSGQCRLHTVPGQGTRLTFEAPWPRVGLPS